MEKTNFLKGKYCLKIISSAKLAFKEYNVSKE